jgi:hypothetical protein
MGTRWSEHIRSSGGQAMTPVYEDDPHRDYNLRPRETGASHAGATHVESHAHAETQPSWHDDNGWRSEGSSESSFHSGHHDSGWTLEHEPHDSDPWRESDPWVTPSPSPTPSSEDRPASPSGFGQIPFISQLTPEGWEERYFNARMNCGPAVMAMLARAVGLGQDMTDAELILMLAEVGGTDKEKGTVVRGITMMAEQLGFNADPRSGADLEQLNQDLDAGRPVVALGDSFELPWSSDGSRTAGHYILVIGRTGDGQYIVLDPMGQAGQRTVSPETLRRFITEHPVGGAQIAISR